jgi:hypothetical protein
MLPDFTTLGLPVIGMMVFAACVTLVISWATRTAKNLEWPWYVAAALLSAVLSFVLFVLAFPVVGSIAFALLVGGLGAGGAVGGWFSLAALGAPDRADTMKTPQDSAPRAKLEQDNTAVTDKPGTREG